MKKRTKHLSQQVRHHSIKRSPNQIISEILFRAISTLDGKIISTESLLEESSNALKNILSHNKQVSDSFADKTSSLESCLNSITSWFLLSGSIKCCWVFNSGWTASLNAQEDYIQQREATPPETASDSNSVVSDQPKQSTGAHEFEDVHANAHNIMQ